MSLAYIDCDCGFEGEVDPYSHTEVNYCPSCGEPRTENGAPATIPREALEELVFEWLHNGYDREHYSSGIAHAVNKRRAEQLQDLLDDYE